MANAADFRRPATTKAPIEVVRIGATIGAEIRGVDFSRPVDRTTADAIHDALMEHKVVFFHGAAMTQAQHVAFGRLFGDLTVHPFSRHGNEFPEISNIDVDGDDPFMTADIWHSDETFRQEPPMGSILRCILLPPVGGNTLWADMNAAYEGLSDKMQHLISGLEAVHDFTNWRRKFRNLPPRERHARLAEMEETVPNPTHPVVRTHPVTGKKVLFVNEQFTVEIKGMREDESRALLALLVAQARIPEYQVRYRWTENDMAFWDNRSSQHYAPWDYLPHRRTMQRVTVKGDRPY